MGRSGSNPKLQNAALVAVKVVVANVPANQTAAGAAGAVGALLQLAQSSGDKPHVQIAALEALCGVVLNHPANQIAAGDALSYLLQLAQSGSIASSAAAIALKNLVDCSFFNQQAFHKIIRSAHHRVPVALYCLSAQLQRTFEGSFPEPGLVRKLELWCDEARGAGECRGVADDEFFSVPTQATRQIGDTCFAFAAARSFNRRWNRVFNHQLRAWSPAVFSRHVQHAQRRHMQGRRQGRLQVGACTGAALGGHGAGFQRALGLGCLLQRVRRLWVYWGSV